MSRFLLVMCLLLTCTAAYAGESHSAPKAAGPVIGGSCAECHASLAALNNSKAPTTEDASIALVSQKFLRSAHANKGCAHCHGGDPKTRTKVGAHKEMVADPVSADAGAKLCGECHADIVERSKTSLHLTSQGIKNVWFKRLGTDESTCKAAKASWKGKACVDCHASCGTCHIKGPTLDLPWEKKKGLSAGHEFLRFEKREDTEKTCYACHVGTITDPDGGFQKNDLHYKAGMQCMSCHNEHEVHGDGIKHESMIHSGAVTTECISCHQGLTGRWHSERHLSQVTCQSCHTMPYRVCYECHGWAASDPKSSVAPMFKHEYTIKLGKSYGKITTLMKGPVDSKMVTDDGFPHIPSEKMNTHSTWYPGVPHSVIRLKPNQDLCNRCHGPGTALLREIDLQYPEHERQHLVPPLKPVEVNR